MIRVTAELLYFARTMERISPKELARVAAGFPRDVRSKLSSWPMTDPSNPVGNNAIEPVIVNDEEVHIPYGVYFGDPILSDARSKIETAMIHCVYTRHHDGYRRESHLKHVLRSPSPWAAPYLMRLLGEPVVEIVERIESALTAEWTDELRIFAQENDAFMRLTKARARSYWDFYRLRFHTVADYPTFRILEALG